MPAKSKAQRRLFALALQYKKGELKAADASDEIKDLAKLPLKDLEDFAYTDEKGLPDKVEEEAAASLNPNMNVQGMGDVSLPGNPGSANSFATQKVGSGDAPEGKKKKKKKKVLLLSFDKFMDLLHTK